MINKADIGGGMFNGGGVVDAKIQLEPRSPQSQLRPDHSSLNEDME